MCGRTNGSKPTLQPHYQPCWQPVASIQDPVGMPLEELPVNRVVVGEYDDQICFGDLGTIRMKPGISSSLMSGSIARRSTLRLLSFLATAIAENCLVSREFRLLG
jgi:hypothetical protein